MCVDVGVYTSSVRVLQGGIVGRRGKESYTRGSLVLDTERQTRRLGKPSSNQPAPGTQHTLLGQNKDNKVTR